MSDSSKQDQEQGNLLIALQRETNALLGGQELYSVLDYAWQDEDTPSDDYIGLAMWTSDAPFHPRWNIWDRTSPPPTPSPRDEAFYKAGEDFFGTMELARNALGIALYSYEHRHTANLLDKDEPFWEHTAIASVWLNVAADRIRDYLLTARFGMTAKEYKKSRGRNDYLRPFLEADSAETANAKVAWEELQADARKLENRRTLRNHIVHSVTSLQGRHAVEAVRRQREESRQQPYQPRKMADFANQTQSWEETTRVLEEERRIELEKEIQDLKEWYLLLVHAAARVFEYEYWRRIGR